MVEGECVMEKASLSQLNEDEFCQEILRRITWIMNQKGIRQLELAKMSHIGQSTLSKLMKGETRLTLQNIYRICDSLGITMEELFAEDFGIKSVSEYEGVRSKARALLNENYIDTQLLLRDTSHPAFRGYVENKLYFYCFSTVSSEASSILEGEIEFKAKDGFCRAELSLYTGKTDIEGRKIVKKYCGEMLISITMANCYCIMVNTEIGEICSLYFRHFYLFNQELLCRVGSLQSTSSGENKLPVVQRALLSKVKLQVSGDDTSDLAFLRGQLKMNDSVIRIKEDEMREIRDLVVSQELQNFLDECENLADKQTYLKIEESKIKAMDSFSIETKAEGIALLREKSSARRYTKVSSKADEYTFAYISGKQRIGEKE